MANKNALILVAAAGIGYYLLTQKKAIGLLNYYIKNIDGIDYDGLTPILKMTIGIQNPSNTSFQVRDVLGNLTIDNQNIGTVSSFFYEEIPGASEVFYPLSVRLSLIGVTETLISLLQYQRGNPITVNFKGFINASGIVAPVDMSYKISF